MTRNPNIQTIRHIFFDQGFLELRPWPDSEDCLELRAVPGEEASEGWFGPLSIVFGSAESLKDLAQALNEAAAEMDR